MSIAKSPFVKASGDFCLCIYNLKLVVTLEQGGKSYGFADLHGRRKKEKEKKKIHPLNTTDEVKMAMSFEKKKKILGYIAKIESSVVFIE